jgi:hypothetical protein
MEDESENPFYLNRKIEPLRREISHRPLILMILLRGSLSSAWNGTTQPQPVL